MLLGDIIVKPDNSLIYQSRDAGYHPGVVDATGKRNIRVNGDGFGVSWYAYDLPSEQGESDSMVERVQDATDCSDMSPSLGNEYDINLNGKRSRRDACCFKFITPAWSNKNLRNIGNHVQSSLIFAHIRAASAGIDANEDADVVVNEENCHPFQYKYWTFMHNGGIPQFQRLKRAMLDLIDEDAFAGITGNTDSEHIFALFLTLLGKHRERENVELEIIVDAVEALLATISQLSELHMVQGNSCACSLNIVVSDGVHVVASRFRSRGPNQVSNSIRECYIALCHDYTMQLLWAHVKV